ncbi:MAG TPA: hypothetical protein VI855_05065, partial [Dehalococcoidia bacterium]|nr:hypothetical protein [Dehalococcoidia bacterium]
MLHTGSGHHTFHWTDGWAKLPASDSARQGWAHHGLAITEQGEVLAFHQGESRVLVLDLEGNLRRSWRCDLTEGHGLTLVKEGRAERLWLADPGRKRTREHNYQYPATASPISGRVVKTDLRGRILMELAPPKLPVYQRGNYCPTSVAVDEERFGGSGDIWMADGYGQSYVHRYDKAGNHLASLSGEEGTAGRFNTPHGIFIDRRKSEPELYVADRSNRQVQVYGLDGRFRRAFGSDFLTSPSAFAIWGDSLIVAELRSRLAVLDGEDRLVCYLGENGAVAETPGWPNVPAERIVPGKFNSPHGLAVDRDGNLYVAEWLIGG